MALYNTPSDAANTAVRAFLTKVGEHYLGKSFNTATGHGKSVWEQIRKDFAGSCAYCGVSGAIQMEHLVMFNRSEYGLHHPGNVVPVCSGCNKRQKDSNNTFVSWQTQLASKCEGDPRQILLTRKKRILGHIAKHRYPDLTTQERHAIRVIAESLYENIKGESEKSLSLYRKLDEAFVKGDITIRSIGPPPTAI